MAIIVIKKSYFQNHDANSFRPMKVLLEKNNYDAILVSILARLALQ